MNQVRLPALDGFSPLGILAAIGTLRLLNVFGEDRARLSWSTDDLVAVLHTGCTDVSEVVARLQAITTELGTGSVLPGVPTGFPPPGAAPDRLRLPQLEYGVRAQEMLSDMSESERREAMLWLASLATDLGDDGKGRVAISQYTAPSGKQSMATMLSKPLDLALAHPEYLHQALVSWRRIAGVTGEYLDHRAMWDTTQSGDGRDGNTRGVPGATWLALMSYPLFRTTWSARKRPVSSGWHTVTKGRRYEELRLPVWDQPLSPAGVAALIEHPALSTYGPDGELDWQLRRLGVVRVCRARRHQPAGAKSAGVLTTIQ